MSDTIFFNLGLALALGLLIGVERGWQARAVAEGGRIAGIRTFGLIGLLGGLLEFLARDAWEIIFGVGFLAFVILMAVAHFVESRATHSYGVTTIVAGLITFVLGALAVRGLHAVAATAAVVTTILLSAKPILHKWVEADRSRGVNRRPQAIAGLRGNPSGAAGPGIRALAGAESLPALVACGAHGRHLLRRLLRDENCRR